MIVTQNGGFEIIIPLHKLSFKVLYIYMFLTIIKINFPDIKIFPKRKAALSVLKIRQG